MVRDDMQRINMTQDKDRRQNIAKKITTFRVIQNYGNLITNG